ncbi:DEAD/DEAH box helicase family protein [Sulfitobacter mediterraneus]|uniref:type I restriction endonuclease subunit R n=1 Tax=Sulfitobacter mediterraneus TaxID=83219 RepID=UPI0021A7A683|nr:DEAD/DEAH box helicase family protein [Sulfitobacter mediterraneus]UWR12446.1 DEAD/DEAH box helicase family protein [Sulfitobacter mediterraneus]
MSTPNQNPEQIARDKIDAQLRASGWTVQNKSELDPAAAQGVAVREYQTDVGPADYVLFVDGQAAGVLEAKPESWGQNLTTVEEQSGGYAAAKLKWVNNAKPLPFVYEGTGAITRFTNGLDPKPRSREVFAVHRPETLKTWLAADQSLRTELQDLPELNVDGLRDCQVSAITKLEASLKEDRPRALIQMATGSGKTFTAITEVYRLLKHADAKRVLFLVDTKNLGEQAEQEFMSFLPNDDNRKFTELYNVQRLKSKHIAGDSQVCISTIQRMYAILKDEELPEGSEDENPAETWQRRREPLPVVYNEKIPPEYFDFIVIDEAHRSIYNLWRQVIEYFDAYLIGLTATPDDRTFGFFQKNVVSEYTHEDAVADGVNVGNEIYVIETEITQKGAELKAKQLVERREKMTRKKRWEQQDENEAYSAKKLDRSVVNKDQIRTVVRAFRDKLPEIFPGRNEVPKTLIFAKTDSHADDIIQMVRLEFGEGNDFCRKITSKTEGDPKSVLSSFRNDFYPRIAVTVDMIATGTDVKPLECLLFMRDVKSKNYFEQMKGRGTRVLKPDDLQKVTPSAKAKTHYVIVDAIGVTKSLKTASQPLDTKPSIPLKDLAMGIMMGAARDIDSVSSLAGRLSRIDHQIDETQRAKVEEVAGQPLRNIIKTFFDSVDPDAVMEDAKAATGQQEPDEAAQDEARSKRIGEAAKSLNGTLINLLDTIRRDLEQTVDHDNLDHVTRAEWAGDTDENAKVLSQDFEAYLNDNRDRLEALTIYFSQPARRSEITFEMIREVLDALRADAPRLAPLNVWRAYAHLDEFKGTAPDKELEALVALIRRVAGLDETLTPHSDRIRKNFQNWVLKRHAGKGDKFNETQMDWLRMMRDHLATSFHIETDDLDMAPFDGQGGLGRMYQLFGNDMEPLMAEMNEAVAG